MANSLVFERYDPENTTHTASAAEIPRWQDWDQHHPDYQPMLKLTPEVLAQHVFGIICLERSVDGEPTPVGYNAATFEFPGQVFEIGGVIVNPEYRGRGIAKALKTELLAQLAQLYPAHSLIAFTNANSEHLFREYDYKDACSAEVPADALAICAKECPSYKKAVVDGGKLCCDTILTRKLVTE